MGKSGHAGSPTTGQSTQGVQKPTGMSQQGQESPNARSSQPSGKNAQQSSSPSNNSAQQPSRNSTQNARGTSHQQQNRSTSGNAPSNERVNLSSQQKTEIKSKVIENKSAPRVSHVNFNVGVGVAVPGRVHLAPVPAVLVGIHPAWKSYEYFVYEEEVIIVDPHTRKIVEIIVVS
jgi:hypothetical protein